MLIDIEKVIIKDRIRKDFGNIEELAQDIKDNGLINPPVVTPDYELIAGERRLRAMKHLDYKQITVNIMTVRDYEHQLNLEISENETRKDFSRLERLDYARRLEKIERLKAKERQSCGQGGILLSENFPKAKTTDVVAQKLGIGSGKQYEKEKYIADNADEDTLSQWDKGDISTHKAYIELKKEKEKLELDVEVAKESAKREYQLRQDLQNQPPQIVEILPADYEQVKSKFVSLAQKIKESEYKIEQLEREKSSLTRQASNNDKEAKEYQELKKSIEFMQREKSDLSRQIESATEFAGLTVEIDKVLKEKLAPIKYSRIMERMDSEVAVENLTEIVTKVESWCREMRGILPNSNIIDVEVIR